MNVYSVPLDTIRDGYNELGRQVTIALQTQQGDAARLQERHRDCQHLLGILSQVCIYQQSGSAFTDPFALACCIIFFRRAFNNSK